MKLSGPGRLVAQGLASVSQPLQLTRSRWTPTSNPLTPDTGRHVQSAQLTDDFADNFLANVYRLWLVPEVQRRLASGTIAGDTKVWAGQVLFEMDRTPEIRLNDEVNGIFHVHPEAALPEGITLSAENALAIAAHVVSFQLTDDDRPDAAHITVLIGDGGFYIDFDMRYNASVVAELVIGAREFLETARHAQTIGRSRAFIANLHIAVELLAKAHLLLHPDNEILTSRKHGFLRRRYNLHSHRGGTEQRFARLLNRLDELRNPARYSSAPLLASAGEADALLEDCDAMLAHVVAAAPARTRGRLAPGV
jgi:HEPN domain-containing protein